MRRMARLIDAEPLETEFDKQAHAYRHGGDDFMDGVQNGYALALRRMKNAPTVEERHHGEWKEMWHSGKGVYSCTECFEAYKMPILYNFCPNCGADMRPKEGDEE